METVRDHCHTTGQYRGCAYNECNLKLRLNPKTMVIPVVFHILRSYDSHLLMQAISKVESKICCIPNNTEKYIYFSLGQLWFINSIQFLLFSLDNFVKTNKSKTFQPSMSLRDENCCFGKASTPMSTWAPENGLQSLSSLQRKHSTASSLKNIFPTMTTPMHIKSGRPLGVVIWRSIMTSTSAQMSSF